MYTTSSRTVTFSNNNLGKLFEVSVHKKFKVLKMLSIAHGPSKVAGDFAPTVIFYFLQFTLLTLFSLMSGAPTGCLGGGVKLPPPSIFLLWYKYMTFGKPLGLTSLIGKKMVKIQQQKTIAIAKSSYSANNVPKMRNCNKLYIFENPLTQRI